MLDLAVREQKVVRLGTWPLVMVVVAGHEQLKQVGAEGCWSGVVSAWYDGASRPIRCQCAPPPRRCQGTHKQGSSSS